MIDREDTAFQIKQHHPLLHIGGDRVDCVSLLAQPFDLLLNQPVLLADLGKKRLQLLIGRTARALLQIVGQRLDRTQKPARQT